MIVALHGSYYGYNFGDTLLCWLFNNWIKENEFVDSTALPFANWQNQKAIGADRRGVRTALNAQAFVFCGGGYFSEALGSPTKWAARAFFRHLLLATAVRRLGKPLAILGVGVGPITNATVRRGVLSLFEYAEVAAVRDIESATTLRDWGLRRDVLVVPDAVAVSNLKELFNIGHSKRIGIRERRLGVHISGQPTASELEAARQICEWALFKKDVQIILITDGMPRRRPIVWPDEIRRRFPGLHASIRYYDGDINSMIAFLASLDGIVTTKLHVGIVATVLEVPVISVPHHEKTFRFYRQIGKAENVIDQSGLDWQVKLETALESWYIDAFSPRYSVPEQNPYASILNTFLSHHQVIS